MLLAPPWLAASPMDDVAGWCEQVPTTAPAPTTQRSPACIRTVPAIDKLPIAGDVLELASQRPLDPPAGRPARSVTASTPPRDAGVGSPRVGTCRALIQAMCSPVSRRARYDTVFFASGSPMCPARFAAYGPWLGWPWHRRAGLILTQQPGTCGRRFVLTGDTGVLAPARDARAQGGQAYSRRRDVGRLASWAGRRSL